MIIEPAERGKASYSAACRLRSRTTIALAFVTQVRTRRIPLSCVVVRITSSLGLAGAIG
jgi:hypothetical protein